MPRHAPPAGVPHGVARRPAELRVKVSSRGRPGHTGRFSGCLPEPAAAALAGAAAMGVVVDEEAEDDAPPPGTGASIM